MNIEMDYIYRDAGNNKITGSAIFKCKETDQIEEIDGRIRQSLIDEMFFVAEDVGVQPLRFDSYDRELDHGWHEYGGVTWTESLISDEENCDIERFLTLLKHSKRAHDRLFEGKC